MAHATVGVIGHVNHGKTRLVHALTGTDTDRLEEEKRRGMSIVLGFAYLALPGGILDLVDAPGHEQFVRTMVAGATGIDASLLVVDAREGIKPQTVEHVAIADLLGVKRGVVALTKADLVDTARRREVQRALRGFLRGTHLEFAPVVFTSAASGEGLPELRARLEALLQDDAAHAAGAHFWLPVDRVFSLRGHGLVATGTLRGGALRVGDAVSALPGGAAGTVRQLQVHNQPVEVAWPGQRVGVNLRRIAADALARGDVLAPPEQARAGVLVDVELRLLASAPADSIDGRWVRLLFGTTEVSAVVRILGAGPGGNWLAQLRTLRPIVAMAGEAFIVRRESPAATLGGGRILDAAPARHARSDQAAQARLRALAGGDAEAVLVERLRAAGATGLPLPELAAAHGITPAELVDAASAFAVADARTLWHAGVLREAQQRIEDALRDWHAAQPLRPAAPLSVCRGALPPQAGDAFHRKVMELLQQEGRVVVRQATARLAGHDAMQALDASTREALLALGQAFRDGGLQPPDPPSPQAQPRERALLDLLVARGEVLLLPGQPPTQKIAFHQEALADAQQRLAAAFPPPVCFTVSEARALLGSTRKFTVPLLQHLQASGRTRRRGDLHMFVQETSNGGA